MKAWLLAILIILVSSVKSIAVELVQHDPDSKQIVFQNETMQALVSYNEAIHIDSITYSNQPFLRKQNQSLTLSYGSALKLYKQHPKHSRDSFTLPNQYKAMVESNGGKAVVLLESSDASPFFIEKKIHFSQNDTSLYIETIIKNQSEENIEIYPAEEIVFSAEFGISGLLNPNFRLYSPVSDNIESVTDMAFVKGNPIDSQFKIDQRHNIFQLKHERREADFMYTRKGNWLAVASIRDLVKKTGIVCGVDFSLVDSIDNVEDNVIVLTSGLKKIEGARPIYPLSTQVTYVHGKTTLSPCESFSYKQTWGLGSSVLPIREVRDGIAFFRRLEAYKLENGYAMFSISTNPSSGITAFQCLNEDGLPFRTDTVMVMNPQAPGAGTTLVESSQPLLVSSNYSFGLVLPVTATQSTEFIGFATQETPAITSAVRFVILDPQTKEPIRTIDEVSGPWRDYDAGEIK